MLRGVSFMTFISFLWAYRVMSFRGLGIEDSERIEAQSGLVELLGELGLPCSCRIERLVLDAVEVRRELHPLLVEHAHAFPAERGDREAELEIGRAQSELQSR